MSDMEITDEVVEFFESLNDEPAAEETTETEVAPEEGEQPDEAEVEGEEASEEEHQEEVEEAPEEEQVEEQPEEELHPAEIARREQQAIYDRKLAEMQQQIAAQNQWQQQQYQYQQEQLRMQQEQAQQQTQQQLHVTAEQLEAGIENDLAGTFRWVAHNRPDLVPAIASRVREHEAYGNQVADAMLVEFNQFQVQRATEQYQEQIAQQQAPQQVEQVMGQIIQGLEQRHGEAFSGLKGEIAEEAGKLIEGWGQWMTQQGHEIRPQDVADFVTQVYFDVRQQKLNTVAQQPRKPQKLTPNQHVENPTAITRKESTPDEDAMNELLEGARSLGIDVTPASA